MVNDVCEGGRERGKYGVHQILVDNLENEYTEVGKDLKAKVWESDSGERRLYLRVRDSEDWRKFNLVTIDLNDTKNTDSDR